jgi:hypothetical protein
MTSGNKTTNIGNINAGAVSFDGSTATNYGKADPILQFFAYEHLPPHLKKVSQPFCDLARELVGLTPRNPERSVALRKLLEAKDAAVRAAIFKQD